MEYDNGKFVIYYELPLFQQYYTILYKYKYTQTLTLTLRLKPYICTRHCRMWMHVYEFCVWNEWRDISIWRVCEYYAIVVFEILERYIQGNYEKRNLSLFEMVECTEHDVWMWRLNWNYNSKWKWALNLHHYKYVCLTETILIRNKVLNIL